MTGSVAIEKIRKEQEKFIALAKKLWECPETAYNEVNACKWTAELLKEFGFEVKTGERNLDYGSPGRDYRLENL